MPRKPLPLTEQLRRAIDSCGMSRYRICQLIDLDQATMSRFMGRYVGLDIKTVDKLGELLGLRIVVDNKSIRKDRTVNRGEH